MFFDGDLPLELYGYVQIQIRPEEVFALSDLRSVDVGRMLRRFPAG